MLISKLCAAGSIFAATASATSQAPFPVNNNNTFKPDANGKYEISAEGIRALFIPYGASIANLFINDTNGIERDIVLGFDNASHYSVDPFHPHLGGVPGANQRYPSASEGLV
jgi:aldose 1-epimerase